MFTLTKKAETIEEKEALILYRLTKLTITGEIKWKNESDPFIARHYACKMKGFEFETEWLRDDRPKLMISRNAQAPMLITGGIYGHTVESLITTIEARLPLNNQRPIEQPDDTVQRNNNLDDIIEKICV